MKLKQTFISVFFLFAYSLAFAHSMMPHEHGFFAEHQPESHNHEHHNHTDNNKETPHLHHNDHCDEGFVDLILCVLNDFNHHHDDCDDEHLIFEESKRLKNTVTNNSNTYFVADYSSYSKTVSAITTNSNGFDFGFCNIYKGLSKDSSPLRGPPVKFI